jgi:hypothetical protein
MVLDTGRARQILLRFDPVLCMLERVFVFVCVILVYFGLLGWDDTGASSCWQ